MGEQKTNVPARFDAETLSLIERDAALHKMTLSQYIRESMIEWLRLRVLGAVQLIDGTVRLLEVSAQQEHKNLCALREQREQSSQIEFPAHIAAPIAGPKPLRRAQALQGKPGASRRELSGVSRRSCVGVRWAQGTSFLSHSTRFNRWRAA